MGRFEYVPAYIEGENQRWNVNEYIHQVLLLSTILRNFLLPLYHILEANTITLLHLLINWVTNYSADCTLHHHLSAVGWQRQNQKNTEYWTWCSAGRWCRAIGYSICIHANRVVILYWGGIFKWNTDILLKNAHECHFFYGKQWGHKGRMKKMLNSHFLPILIYF